MNYRTLGWLLFVAMVFHCGCNAKVKPRKFEIFLNHSYGTHTQVELLHPSGEKSVIPISRRGPLQTTFQFAVLSPGTHYFRVIVDSGDCIFAMPIETDTFGESPTSIEVNPPDSFAMDVILPVLPGLEKSEAAKDLTLRVSKVDDPCGKFGWSMTDPSPFIGESRVEGRIAGLSPGRYLFELMQSSRSVMSLEYRISGDDSGFELKHVSTPWKGEQ
jgi:hypothetical protein